MKKILRVLFILGIFLIPNVAHASSYHVNYYCDAKQPVDDDTFKMTCHLQINTDMDLNHVKGSLILKNVTLESIKTNNDWVNKNGLSTNIELKSTTTHTGSFSVADFTFTGNRNDTECEASYVSEIVEKIKEEKQVCAIVDDKYYGKNGSIVNEETYYEECCNYVCTVVDNKYYFNATGKSVSYDEMLEDCKTHSITNPSTGIDYGYIILPIGIISIVAIIRFAKKNTKIYKI